MEGAEEALRQEPQKRAAKRWREAADNLFILFLKKYY
jgi:hypothetical protein